VGLGRQPIRAGAARKTEAALTASSGLLSGCDLFATSHGAAGVDRLGTTAAIVPDNFFAIAVDFLVASTHHSCINYFCQNSMLVQYRISII
jgi:hypothetical protein